MTYTYSFLMFLGRMFINVLIYFQFRPKVEPTKWPIGKDDPDPIIPGSGDEQPSHVDEEAESHSQVAATTAQQPQSSSQPMIIDSLKSEDIEPVKLAHSLPEPALNPNVPEFVPSFVASKVSAPATRNPDPNDEEGTDGDTEEEPEDDQAKVRGSARPVDKTGADWVEVRKKFCKRHRIQNAISLS